MKAKGKQIRYQVSHPLIGSRTFDTWEELCEAAIAAGELESQRILQDVMTKIAFLYSDQIVANAEELIIRSQAKVIDG